VGHNSTQVEATGEGLASFIKGMSGFVLGKFYLRMKKQHSSDGRMPRDLQQKIKAAFSVVESLQ
jgi:hypothetical protein